MAEPQVIIYHYSHSPYARRVIWYLALRGIPYSQCMQPLMMPRPDISRLGISYRRIPVVSIGRDVYLDTRLQLLKLEAQFPELPRLGASDPDQAAVEKLLASWTNDSGLFGKAAQLLPMDLPMLKDPAYYRDRGDFIGAPLSPNSMGAARPEAIGAFARTFDLLETTLLADGRDWVLKTPSPSLADIEAIWPIHWLSGIPGALPKEHFSPAAYPRVYAWVQRFQDAVSAARKKTGKPATVSGEEAAEVILGSRYSEAEIGFDESDPVIVAQGLQKGDRVAAWPTDTGSSGRDVGRLIGVGPGEVVYETGSGDKTVRVHAPRHRFRIKKQASSDTKL